MTAILFSASAGPWEFLQMTFVECCLTSQLQTRMSTDWRRMDSPFKHQKDCRPRIPQISMQSPRKQSGENSDGIRS